MARDPEDEQRESVVDIMVRWREQAEAARGVPPERAREIANRDVRALLQLVGGRKWYLPRSDSYEKDAMAGRDEAIRQAHRRGVPMVVILRTFRIRKTRFYEIIRLRKAG